MNSCALRTERAVADYLFNSNWSLAGAGKPSILVSYGRGLNDDEDLEDVMPSFPRLVITATSSTPVMPQDLTCEVQVEINLQLSADDTEELDILSTVGTLQNLILPLYDDGGCAVLTKLAVDPSGPYTGRFAIPAGDSSGVDNRSRTFTTNLTIYGSATI